MGDRSRLTASTVAEEPEDGVSRMVRTEVSEWDKTYGEALENPSESIDFLLTPYVLERMILYGMLISADSFVFTIAFLPIRVLFAAVEFLWGVVRRGRAALGYIARVDVARATLIAIACLVVYKFDLGTLARIVKMSEIKIKMVWMCMEFLDKVLSAWGNTILGSLFWALRCREAKRKWSLAVHFCVGAWYLSVHSLLLLLHLSVLNIAVGSGNSTLLSLVILVQFAEMKSAANKALDREKLSEQCDEDITERFQLLILVGLLYLHNVLPASPIPMPTRDTDSTSLFTALAILYFSELVVDWVKHTAIANTNNVLPGFYVSHIRGLVRESTATPTWANPLTDESLSISRRIGLCPLPLVVIIIKISADAMRNLDAATMATVAAIAWVSLVVLRFALRIAVAIAARIEIFAPVDSWLELRDFMPEKKKKEKDKDK